MDILRKSDFCNNLDPISGPEVTISVSGNAAAQQLEQLEPSTGYSMTITSHQGADLREHKLLRLTPGSKYLVRLQSDMGGVYTEAITTEFTTGDLRFPFPSDCSQELLNGVQESGLVEIFPLGQASVPVSVYCDMETDGGGWTVRAVAKEQLGAASASVFQRRVNGKVNFFRPWKEYVNGFGDRSEEFWLGNELIYNLTKMNPMSLRVDMRAEGETVFAKYSSFSVGPAKLYTLQVSGYTGTADWLVGQSSPPPALIEELRLIRHKTQENKQRFFGLLARLTVAETDHRITVLMNMLTMEAKHHKTRRTYGDARVPVKMGVYGVVMAWLNMQHGIPG
ncbi:hypothetical protein ACEWY4_026502 [Coilia grayii]|uniref:Fibrinogen C-terminal domain-containing protein n=1 Tax=Coilia grayii TaxID=363190 RepID=A0ABD1IV18_9TELE